MPSKGFATHLTLVSILAIAVIGFAGYRVLHRSNAVPTQKQQAIAASPSAVAKVTWQWTGTEWKPNGKAPECSQPLKLTTPVDLSKVTAVLYPGQVRGGDFKAHGGFRFDNSDNAIEVKLAYDSHLVGAGSYLEKGEVQYVLDFQNSCGIALRYDHILVPTSSIKQLLNELPAPKENASQGMPIDGPEMNAGTVIATAVGLQNPRNVGVDFGVSDLRSVGYPNAGEPKDSFARYGVCWLRNLNKNDSAMALSLPGSGTEGKASVYCQG